MAHIFDIIGPIMVGPSSSHTAGAARIGKLARIMLQEPVHRAEIKLYGSFAETYLGHGTHLAVLGGLLGYDPDDLRIRQSDSLAREAFGYEFVVLSGVPVDHPNTMRLSLAGETNQIDILGVSVGGGRIRVTEIDGFPVKLNGENIVLVIHSVDRPGVITLLTSCLASENINIGNMTVSRQGKGSSVVMTIEIDAPAEPRVLDRVRSTEGVQRATQIIPL
jgi:L-serine dehydratase